MSECKLKIGITQGDPNGIGWEVILKALSDPRMTELFTPVVYGSPAAAAYYRNTLGDTEPVAFNTVPAARDTRRAWTEWSRNPLQRAEREKGGRDISVKDLPQTERED